MEGRLELARLGTQQAGGRAGRKRVGDREAKRGMHC